MSIDYILASLPVLAFDQPAPISWERFIAIAGEALDLSGFADLETQLKNALAVSRGGVEAKRPAVGCSLYWKNRVTACFQESDVFKREELLDRVWWEAAGELTAAAAPLGKGALATYAVRLKIALKRSKISTAAGKAAFDRLTSSTKIEF